ncbi:MAG TPA: response regulator [Labilithrix sp.]|jgi:CheY-like chemotaxis protein
MSRALVLVVDDTQDNREMYMEYLRHVGFTVASAATGEEAIEKTRELVPAVVLMDLSLPGIDGCDATAILKSDPKTRHIPIIALTGHVDAEHRARAMRVGCDRFVAKPSLPADIARHVIELIDDGTARESNGG